MREAALIRGSARLATGLGPLPRRALPERHTDTMRNPFLLLTLPPHSSHFDPHINPLHLAILHHLVRQSFRERRAEIDHQQSIGDGE